MSDAAVTFDRVTITHPGARAPVLRDIDLEIEEGELALVVGRTGSGKSTLLGAINGIVPHHRGGTLMGTVAVHGVKTSDHRPRDFAGLVGVVGQDPLAGFVSETVEEELAYGMEQLGLERGVMRKRVEETLDLLGIAELRDAPLRDLSGGQQQRVAIGSVLTSHPRVLVLDEPTSALDPTGAEEVLAAITRLVHDLAVTVVLAEHRVERVLQYADSVIHIHDGRADHGAPTTAMRTATIAPAVVHLGRWAGWEPLPLSVRDAWRSARDLRRSLAADGGAGSAEPPATVGDALLRARGVTVRYGDHIAVRRIDLDLAAGQVAALMGRNGCGKSSLMWAMQGTGRRDHGTVTVIDAGSAAPPDTADLAPRDRRRRVGLVPQTPADLLYLPTVGEECHAADQESGAPAGACRALLDRLVPGVPDDRHPRDLSEGQRLGLVLAVQLTAEPGVMLLDEPTRGLDYDGKSALAEVLRGLAADGRSVLLSTHDVEFAAEVADRVVVMAAGEIVADGAAAEVLTASPAFAPQITKVLGHGLLTLADVEARFEGGGDGDGDGGGDGGQGG